MSTEIQALKPEEARVRLARLLGVKTTRFKFSFPGHDNQTATWYASTREQAEKDREMHAQWGATEVVEFEDISRVPRYDTSLDAIAEIEAGLTDAQRERYEVKLKLVCGDDFYERKTHWSPNPVYAKASQRAVALIATLSKQHPTE